jgi:hypothetical protein
MTDRQHDHVERGVEILDDDADPLGARVQRLVDALDGTDVDARECIVRYGRRYRHREDAPSTGRHLAALRRLAGTHGIEVRTADFVADRAADSSLPPATTAAAHDIDVERVSLCNGCIAVGEEVDLTATLHNSAPARAERALALAVDGELIHEVDAVLAGGESGALTYTLWFAAPGVYEISVAETEPLDLEVRDPSAGVATAERAGDAVETPASPDGPVPVSVRATTDCGHGGRAAQAPTAQSESPGTGPALPAIVDADADPDPIDPERCDPVFADADASVPADVDATGLLVVDENQYVGVVRIGTQPVAEGSAARLRTLDAYLEPFLSGIGVPTTVVAVPPGPSRGVSDGAARRRTDAADPITVALSECRDAFATDGAEGPSLRSEYYVLTRIDATDVDSPTGFLPRLLPGSDAAAASRRTALRELDDRLRTVRQVLEPLDLAWERVADESVARTVLGRAAADDADGRAEPSVPMAADERD